MCRFPLTLFIKVIVTVHCTQQECWVYKVRSLFLLFQTLLVYKMAEQLHQWVIIAHRKLPSAIYAVDFFDDHLHVVTTCGLHIIQFSNEASFDKYGLQLESEASEELSVEEGMMTASVDNEEE